MYACQGFAFLLASVALAPQQPGASYTLEQEAALGRQMASQLNAQLTATNDPAIQEYINKLGHRLAAAMPDAPFPFTFKLIADDPCTLTHEPVWLPGGYVFVPAALFIEARSEAEFAGMLAHAMEHIAERHSLKAAIQNQSANPQTVPLIGKGGWIGSCSGTTNIPVALLSAQRSYEAEADGLALRAMARAGFDPSALADYIGRTGAPVATITETIRQRPPSDYEVTSSEFSAIRERLAVTADRRKSRAAPTLLRSQVP